MLAVAPHTNDASLATLADLEIFLVVVGEMVASSNVSCVNCDDGPGIELACDHLSALGHRRIAFVGGPHDLTTARRREAMYIKFCRAKKLRLPREFIQAGAYTMQSGRLAGVRLLSAANRPTTTPPCRNRSSTYLKRCWHATQASAPRRRWLWRRRSSGAARNCWWPAG